MTLHGRVKQSADTTEVKLSGVIDQAAVGELDRVFSDLRPKIIIDFKEVERLNSYGISLLMRALERTRSHEVVFVECPEAIVDQFQMLDFKRYGRICSLYVLYFCARCGREGPLLVNVSEVEFEPGAQVRAPRRVCSCGGILECAEDLAFLVEHLVR